MIEILNGKYVSVLLASFRGLRSKVLTAAKESSLEKRALIYGNGSPVYLHETPLVVDESDVVNYSIDMLSKDLTTSQITGSKYVYDTVVLTVAEVEDKLAVVFNTHTGDVVVNNHERTVTAGERILLHKEVSHTVIIHDITYEIEYNEHRRLSLVDLLEVLTTEISDDSFYGLTSALGDNILHISHPMVLNNLIANVPCAVSLLFDSTWVYSFKDKPSLDMGVFAKYNDLYEGVKSTLATANMEQYRFSGNKRVDTIAIKETYNDNSNFYCTLPVQIAYFGHVSFPYYGIEQIYINEGDPVGTPVWPITSPNIDAYYSWEVCTGTTAKILEGVSLLFNGNFMSTYRGQVDSGTLRKGWYEALTAMQLEVKRILNKEFGTDFVIHVPSVLDLLLASTTPKFTHIMLNCILDIKKEVSNSGLEIKDLDINVEHIEYFLKASNEYLTHASNTKSTTSKLIIASKYCEDILRIKKNKEEKNSNEEN